MHRKKLKLVGKSTANLFNTWRNFFPENHCAERVPAGIQMWVRTDVTYSDESVCQCLFSFWKIVAPKGWDLNIIEYSPLTTFCGWNPEKTDLFEMTLMLGKIEARGEGDNREWDGWMAYRLHGHEFEWALGVGDGQESLACCSPWGRKVLGPIERLNWTELWKLYMPCT